MFQVSGLGNEVASCPFKAQVSREERGNEEESTVMAVNMETDREVIEENQVEG